MAPTSVVLTGANRGIGLAILQAICKDPPPFPNHVPMRVYACSRSGAPIPSIKSTSAVTVIPSKLDLSSQESIKELASEIAQAEPSGLNVLINNAGVSTTSSLFADKKWVIDVNYRGTRDMSFALLPLMATNGRIVNVSSNMGSLRRYSSNLASRFSDSNITVPQLDELADEYLESEAAAAKSGSKGRKRDAWNGATAYEVSKALENGLTVALAREGKEKGMLINALHPGWVQTEMGYLYGSPPTTPAEGALGPLRLAFKDDFGSITGVYWSDPVGPPPRTGKSPLW